MNLTLRRSIAAAAVLIVPLLSSCGFGVATDKVYNPGVGVNDRSAAVDILGAVIVSSADGSGVVSATLVNNDQQHADALTQITASGNTSGVNVSLAGPVDVTPGGITKLADSTPVTVKGSAVKAGFLVQLTFSFERSKSVTMQIPVVARSGDYADVPTSAPSTSGTPSSSPSTSPAASPSASPSGNG